MKTLIRILLSWAALFALASGSLGLTGCSKDNKGQSKDLVTYDFDLMVDEQKIFDTELLEAADKINNNKAVSHKMITEKLQILSDDSLVIKRLIKDRRQDFGQDYEAMNYVVIIDQDNVFPGKMEKIEDEWTLNAAIDLDGTYGTSFNLMGDVQILDASHFVLLKLYDHALMSATATKENSLAKTAKKYGILRDKSINGE